MLEVVKRELFEVCFVKEMTWVDMVCRATKRDRGNRAATILGVFISLKYLKLLLFKLLGEMLT